jgi:amino acid transporter
MCVYLFCTYSANKHQQYVSSYNMAKPAKAILQQGCQLKCRTTRCVFLPSFERQVGLGWAGRVVAVGALTGIVTALFGALLGQTRVFVTMGRQHLLPAWLVSRQAC